MTAGLATTPPIRTCEPFLAALCIGRCAWEERVVGSPSPTTHGDRCGRWQRTYPLRCPLYLPTDVVITE